MKDNISDDGAELYFNDNRMTSCKARNGDYTAIGVDFYVSTNDNVVQITGITTRKSVASGFLSIPKEDIPEFIEILKHLYDYRQ